MRVLDGVQNWMAGRKTLSLVAAMLFFWAIGDAIMSFVSPLILTDRGISASMMGLIIGSSSVGGALFDFLLCRLLPSTNFRRIFTVMLALAACFPLLMWEGGAIWIYIVAMAVWGLYFDLYRIGMHDFVSRLPRSTEGYAGYYGIIEVFVSLGVLIAPLIAGFLIGDSVGTEPLMAALVFLAIAGVLCLTMLSATARDSAFTETTLRRPNGLVRELRIWRRLGTKMFPVLLISLTLSTANAFFWTVGPLFSETLGLGHFSGLFLMSFVAPALIVGWFIGRIAERIGERQTAIGAVFAGSLIIISFGFLTNAYLLIGMCFLASLFLTMAYPALDGAYTNFIAEAKQVQTEIETIEDSSYNLGWVIGPILAGFSSDLLGYHNTFVFLGILGASVAIIAWRIMPKSLHVSTIR